MRRLILFVIGVVIISHSTSDSNLSNSIEYTKMFYLSSTRIYLSYYHPIKSQTDSNPLETADQSLINLKLLKNDQVNWLAISRDLLGKFNYGDTVLIGDSIDLLTEWVIRDCMNSRFINSVDILTFPKKSRMLPETSFIIKKSEFIKIKKKVLDKMVYELL